MSDKVRVRLSTARSGGDLLIRATVLDRHKQTFFQAPTEKQAIDGLKARIIAMDKDKAARAEYPRTIEVNL